MLRRLRKEDPELQANLGYKAHRVGRGWGRVAQLVKFSICLAYTRPWK